MVDRVRLSASFGKRRTSLSNTGSRTRRRAWHATTSRSRYPPARPMGTWTGSKHSTITPSPVETGNRQEDLHSAPPEPCPQQQRKYETSDGKGPSPHHDYGSLPRCEPSSHQRAAGRRQPPSPCTSAGSSEKKIQERSRQSQRPQTSCRRKLPAGDWIKTSVQGTRRRSSPMLLAPRPE